MNKHITDIGVAALIPNAALKPLEGLVGLWNTEGSHGLLPNVTLHGRASFEWIENGAFLLWRSEIDDPRFPSGIAIFGSDDVQNKVYQLYFDQRGVSRKFDVGAKDKQVKWWREQPGFSQRCTNTISDDSKTIMSYGE